MEINLEINNKKVTANKGETILDVCKKMGIKIPTLCHIKETFPTGACRMCVVENVNTGKLITSCSYPAEEGMKILTHSNRVAESRKVLVELLLSNHPDDCLYCVRNLNCELQTLSSDLGVRERRIMGVKNLKNLDHTGASLVRDPAKCILCGRCVDACDRIMGVNAIDFINRGSKSEIAVAFNKGLNTSSCINCGRCIMVCPTGALYEKNHYSQIMEALDNPKKHVVVQYAPSISVTMAEEIGLPAGTDVYGILNSTLRKMGFDTVLDGAFSADLTIMEEGSELIHRIQNGGKLPMFTSCCPAWVKYIEEFAPDLLDHLSSAKSPMQMMGALIKTYWAEKKGIDPENIYSVGIMPCIAKKFEAQRVEMTHRGVTDVDAVLTTRELAGLMKIYGIDIHSLEPECADTTMGIRSTAGKIFGAAGGVMEAAVRTAHKLVTGEEMANLKIEALRGFEPVKRATVKIGDLDLNIAAVNGLAGVRQIIDDIRNDKNDLHFIEVMACPGGCINGGGQPLAVKEENIRKRMASLYTIDSSETMRTSHSNPEIQQIYKEYLGEPLSEKSHHLLHTHYAHRDVNK
ncbi:MAG: iron hydrogenase small subunit [Saprospiraceae bacterium]|nr:iron hydrogenase small subunit [Saprospiraceae bacterium]